MKKINLILIVMLTSLIAYSATTRTFNEAVKSTVSVQAGNVKITGNTVSSENANGDLTFDLNGTGSFILTDLTASRVPYLDASKKLKTSAITDTELGYLTGLTSSVQTQLDARVTLTGSQTVTNKDYDGGTASNASRITIPKNTKTNLDGLTRKEATIVYASDEDKLYVDDGATLNEVGSGAGGGAGAYINLAVNQSLNWDAETGATTDFAESGGGTLAIEASTVFQGTYSVAFNASANTDYMTFGPVTVTSLAGGNCIASFYYNGFDANITAQAWDGSNVLNSIALAAQTTWVRNNDLTFPCPSSGSIYIRLYAGADAAIGYFDNAWIGENYNVGTVSQATVVGSLTYAETASCIWSTNSTTLANFAADTDCPAATVTGAVTAPGTKIPGAVVSNSGPGDYMVIATFTGGRTGANSAGNTYGISDGTTTKGTQSHYFNTSAFFAPITTVAYFSYTSSASRTFQVQALTGNSGNTATIQNSGGANHDEANFEIKIFKFPSASQQVYTSDQSDYGWTSDSAIVTTNGFGTPTATSFFKKRIGDTLYVRGWFTAGTVAASQAFLQLASGYVIDTAKISTTANKSLVGFAHQLRTAVGPATTESDTLHFDGSTTNRVFFSYQTGSNIFTIVNGSSLYSTGDTVSFEFSVPIVNWANTSRAPQLVNSVVSPSNGVTNICSGYITNNGTTTMTRSDGNCASVSADNGAGDTSVAFAANTFSSTPNCVCVAENTSGVVCSIDVASAPSSTLIRFQTFITSTLAAQDRDLWFICIGPK